MSELQQFDVSFFVGKGKHKEKVKFSVIHNMPNVFGLSIQNALDNWIPRTEEFTMESFINYIEKKDTGFIIMPKEKFDEILKQKNGNDSMSRTIERHQ